MTAPELKPCPFCGGKPYLANSAMAGYAYVVCTDCEAQGDDASQEGVIAAWNRRADLAAVPAQVRVRPLVWTGGDRVATTGLMLHEVGVVLDRDKVAEFEKERADEILSLLELQPDPRDAVIARLVEAGTNLVGPDCVYDGRKIIITTVNHSDAIRLVSDLRAALAEAKAVQK